MAKATKTAKKKTEKKTVKSQNKSNEKKRKSTTKKKTSTKKTKKKQSKFSILRFLLICLLIIFAVIGGYVFYCYITMPNIEKAISQTRQPMTTILAENGNEINTYGNLYSDVVMLYDLPQHTIDAIVSTEDKRFYSHFGVDFIGLTRAIIANMTKKSYAQGGSTITQQVAKNLFLTPNKTIKRKVQEVLLAFWLEYKFSKDQILTLYINRVYLGSGTYGIEAAARRYFQKPASNLNMKESAIIAAMLKAPSRYNPIANKSLALQRADIVLNTMFKNKFIDKNTLNIALKQNIGSGESYRVKNAMHFSDWVYKEINNSLGEREEDIVVYTTLNQNLQQKIQRIMEKKIAENKNKNITQGAVVILDKNGAIKAMFGGVNYNKSQFNRATQAMRQPGSVFKTFVYITALENGYKPYDKIEDKPVTIGNWTPTNISGKHYGSVTLDYALSQSFNLATVNLAQKLSYKKIIKTAHSMGITTPIKETPAIALGSAETNVIDMASSYATIANEGYYIKPYGISKIESRNKRKIYKHSSSKGKKVLKDTTVENITFMLENVINNGTGKRAKIDHFAAGKTGTSQGYRDAWFVGFTQSHTIAVWLGNDNNSPMKEVGGGTIPAEIWKEIAELEELASNE